MASVVSVNTALHHKSLRKLRTLLEHNACVIFVLSELGVVAIRNCGLSWLVHVDIADEAAEVGHTGGEIGRKILIKGAIVRCFLALVEELTATGNLSMGKVSLIDVTHGVGVSVGLGIVEPGVSVISVTGGLHRVVAPRSTVETLPLDGVQVALLRTRHRLEGALHNHSGQSNVIAIAPTVVWVIVRGKRANTIREGLMVAVKAPKVLILAYASVIHLNFEVAVVFVVEAQVCLFSGAVGRVGAINVSPTHQVDWTVLALTIRVGSLQVVLVGYTRGCVPVSHRYLSLGTRSVDTPNMVYRDASRWCLEGADVVGTGYWNLSPPARRAVHLRVDRNLVACEVVIFILDES